MMTSMEYQWMNHMIHVIDEILETQIIEGVIEMRDMMIETEGDMKVDEEMTIEGVTIEEMKIGEVTIEEEMIEEETIEEGTIEDMKIGEVTIEEGTIDDLIAEIVKMITTEVIVVTVMVVENIDLNM